MLIPISWWDKADYLSASLSHAEEHRFLTDVSIQENKYTEP